MRGKVYWKILNRKAIRITPACAGKSYFEDGYSNIGKDHPRVCGEKFLTLQQSTWQRGSPPRVRGKVWALFPLQASLRITPACAGKRAYLLAKQCVNGDHPRVCGEKIIRCGCRISTARITPACAGKRKNVKSWDISSRDHPRVCGEKDKTLPYPCQSKGSPPRVRGKDCEATTDKPMFRITPACAGKRLKGIVGEEQA